MSERVLVALASLRRGLLIAVAFGLPLIYFPELVTDPFDLPKLTFLLVVVSLVAGVRLAEIILGGPPLRARGLVVPTAALLVPLGISWLGSDHRSWALWGQFSRWQGAIPYVVVALLAILVADAFRGRRFPIAWALAMSGTVVAGYSLVQAFGLDPFWLPGAVVSNGSTIGNPNFTGAFLALTLPIGVYLWVKATRGRLFAVPGCVFSVVSLILLDSQGGWAAAGAGLAILIGGLASQRWSLARPLGWVAAGVVILAVVGSVAAAGVFGSRDAGPILGGTVRDRSTEWMAAAKMAAESPLIGHGPNSYALLGTRYRSTENALASELWKADDPHSLPLTFLANNGLLGFIGIGLIYAWVLRKTFANRDAGLDLALLASAIAYITQSLISIDEISLRATFWVVLGTLAASDLGTPESVRPRASIRRSALAGGAVFAGCALAVWSGGFIRADIRVQHGLDLFAEGSVDDARAEFTDALAFRNEYRYRETYSQALGIAGLNLGVEGAPLIAQMREVDSYLTTFPETIGLRQSARILHYWSRFDPRGDEYSLPLVQRAREMDPNNPAISVLESEILVGLGRAEEAVEGLRRYEAELVGLYADYWSAYALALSVSGDHDSAAEVYDQASALGPGSCRSMITGEVLRQLAASEPVRPSAEFERFRQMICDPGFFHFAVDQMPASAQHFYR